MFAKRSFASVKKVPSQETLLSFFPRIMFLSGFYAMLRNIYNFFNNFTYD